MKTEFWCNHCLCERHGTVIDTSYVVSKLFQRIIKCYCCGKLTIENCDLTPECKPIPMGCFTRWQLRQNLKSC